MKVRSSGRKEGGKEERKKRERKKKEGRKGRKMEMLFQYLLSIWHLIHKTAL